MTEAREYHWAIWPVRISASVAALLLLDQAVFAGQFLSGTFAALHTHRENATYAGITVLVTALCAGVLWRRGRGPAWPLLACLALFALIAVQIMLGFARVLALHVPLGVLTIMAGLHLAVWSWRFRPTVPSKDPTGTTTAAAGQPAEVPS